MYQQTTTDMIIIDSEMKKMDLSQLAGMVYDDWKNVNFAAKPYLAAMGSLSSIDENFGFDSGRSIVNYFLVNANSWRGEVARAVKAELKRRVKR